MKITLEFDNLDEAETAIKANGLSIAIDDARNYIRNVLKHTDVSDETEAHLEKIRDLLSE